MVVTNPASRSTARCWEIVGLVNRKALAMSPAATSRSQIKERISRRTGEVSAPMIFWRSRVGAVVPVGADPGCSLFATCLI